jgi:hypothetical protein
VEPLSKREKRGTTLRPYCLSGNYFGYFEEVLFLKEWVRVLSP